MKKPIYVTQPALPEFDEFIPFLKKIWESKILTNKGTFHRELEEKLAEFLDVPYVSLFANGTLALVTALKVLDIKGEVITTPFSFVATSNSLIWNNIQPVFVDIEPGFCTLDPAKVEAAITPNTSAILPVHVYGNACNVEEFEKLGKKYGLKVIYDAAHAFGVWYKGCNICNYGDLSVLSFHATKVFNTMEGGAVVCHDSEMKKQIDFLRNFGFAGETEVNAIGINAKMNEMQAALGLLQMKHHFANVEKRKSIVEKYRQGISKIKGISVLAEMPDLNWNYAYFPVFVHEKEYGISRDELYYKLRAEGIYARRYFYPLITEFKAYSNSNSIIPDKLENASRLAAQVICLPLYPDLELTIVDEIVRFLGDFGKLQN